MEKFRIDYRPSVKKDLRVIDYSYHKLIYSKIHQLSENPVVKGCRKINDQKNRYRIRVGKYRVIYRVDFISKTVLIEFIRHRREAYRGL